MLLQERIRRIQSVSIWSLEKWGGGALSYEEFRNKYAELLEKQAQAVLGNNQHQRENFDKEIELLINENKDNYETISKPRRKYSKYNWK